MRENAALVLEQNQLLREAEEETRHKVEKIQKESSRRVASAEEELASQRLENNRLVAATARLQEEVGVLKDSQEREREERRKWVSAEMHARAVSECQEAFLELKKNYKTDTTEKGGQIEALQKEVSSLRISLDSSTSANSNLEADIRLNSKMAQKFEELSLTLQVQALVITDTPHHDPRTR